MLHTLSVARRSQATKFPKAASICSRVKSTDCVAKKFLQLDNSDELNMLECQNECTNAAAVSFSHESLQKKKDQLTSPAAHQLVNEVFANSF